MKISGGIASGIPLDAPKGRGARPTAARPREALAASLMARKLFDGATVVDLFAGTGALGLEAASRGAANVFLVERAPKHFECLERNIAKVAKAGVDAKMTAVKGDALAVSRLLPGIAGEVDLILADPPYADTARLLNTILKNAEFAEWARNALMVWEVPDNLNADALPQLSPWLLTERRSFGGARFFFLSQQTG